MKKTIITLMALAGLAMAKDIEINALNDSSSLWEMGFANLKKEGVPSLNNGALTTVLGNGAQKYDWAKEYAIYTLQDEITLSNVEDTLTLTFTFTPASTNALATVTLIDATNNIAVSAGQGKYSAAVQMGSTDLVGKKFFAFKDGTQDNYVEVTTSASAENVVTAKTAITLVNTIAWNVEKNKFVSTVTYGDETLGVIDLGKSFTLSSVAVSMDGNENFSVSTVGIKASIANVPEPATATLSLLALCGLAARRRRK